MSRSAICKYIYQWIDDLRSDIYIAVRVDRFLELINGYLQETSGDGVEKVTEDDLKTCTRFDDSITIAKARDGTEVLLLWSGWRLYDLVSMIIETATREGEVAVSVP